MVELALGMVEREWEERYKILDERLSNLTDWAVSLKAERDEVLSQAASVFERGVHCGIDGEVYGQCQRQTEKLHYLPLAILLLVLSV